MLCVHCLLDDSILLELPIPRPHVERKDCSDHGSDEKDLPEACVRIHVVQDEPTHDNTRPETTRDSASVSQDQARCAMVDVICTVELCQALTFEPARQPVTVCEAEQKQEQTADLLLVVNLRHLHTAGLGCPHVHRLGNCTGMVTNP